MYYPISTYRLQLHSGFTFADVKALIPYLHELGVDTVYASPITAAVPGSTHGYDVTDPLRINPEIGTLEELREIAAMLKERGMRWLQDIVPNHMAFSLDNGRLADVLERGKYSPYYRYFDINWEHHTSLLRDKVLLPVLGGSPEECIKRKELKLGWTGKGPVLQYFDNVYPLCADSLEFLLEGTGAPRLPAVYRTGTLVQWQQAKQDWINAVEADTAGMQLITDRFAAANTDEAVLTAVINRQWYVPACWQQADTGMNYRRFFAVNSLISVRMEEHWVFEDYHGLIAGLYKEGLIQGVRVDHIDGLFDPLEYVTRLRSLLGPDCYIIVEKILEYREQLPEHWPVQGTSGYEFLAFTNQVLTSREGAEKIHRFYTAFTGMEQPYRQLVYRNKYHFLEKYLRGEWDTLVHELIGWQLLPPSFNTERLRRAMGIWMAAFPVYRIYPQAFPLRADELERIQQSLEFAVQQEPACWEELAEIRTLFQSGSSEEQNQRRMQFIRRLMQFTGPLAAKGVEDTTFYVYNPLISHNEVGDSPEQLGITIEAFHEKMQQRRQGNNYSLNATSTHDTKRGEDARLRINVLSELPDEWIEKVREWEAVNKALLTAAENRQVPVANDRYFIYQSLIGGFPADGIIGEEFRRRSETFILKALREAKTYTTYTAPDEDYEKGCVKFMLGLLTHTPFLESFIPFVQKVAEVAALYSLVQVVMKCTAPGIPDIYQGCELWDTSYVDPDNRRPVNYEWRNNLLQQISLRIANGRSTVFQWLAEYRHTGMEKLFVTAQVLHFRKQHAALFNEGAYFPLAVAGSGNTTIAWARRHKEQWVLVILPVAIANGSPANIEVQLTGEAPLEWQDIFTGHRYKNNSGVLELPGWQHRLPVLVLTPAPQV
jgi:(1->4)-alpha-D-glucan 1-alpha-D-glucosylmutase